MDRKPEKHDHANAADSFEELSDEDVISSEYEDVISSEYVDVEAEYDNLEANQVEADVNDDDVINGEYIDIDHDNLDRAENQHITDEPDEDDQLHSELSPKKESSRTSDFWPAVGSFLLVAALIVGPIAWCWYSSSSEAEKKQLMNQERVKDIELYQSYVSERFPGFTIVGISNTTFDGTTDLLLTKDGQDYVCLLYTSPSPRDRG
jgi:hypothetical protein